MCPLPHETREGSNPNRAERLGAQGPPAAGAARVSGAVSESAGRPLRGHRPSTGSTRVTADEARGARGLAQRAQHVNGEGFPGN